MPAIGFGTWQMAGTAAAAAVKEAIHSGYRLIDTAASYGNEPSVGSAIRESGFARENLYIIGKLWNTKREHDSVFPAFTQTLKRLKLDYLDLYLIHWPASHALYENWREVNSGAWAALEKLYADGLVKAIGVSNYLLRQLEALMRDAKIAPMVNQIEIHPGQPQVETVSFCRRHSIQPQAWGPLAQGRVFQNAELAGIAQRYHRSIAQVCLRWCLQTGVVPLPKTLSPTRMRENIDIFNFSITDEDMHDINAISYFGGSGYNPATITEFG
jgi:diketogulonate reductase-like aldo/keto reductase